MFRLDEDECAIVETARGFADEVLAPQALIWDEQSHFPREVGKLGMGGITVRADVGGSGLRRLDAVRARPDPHRRSRRTASML